jgi:hypothetical protein
MKWADPPNAESYSSKRAYEKEARELRENPGKWGIVTSVPLPAVREGKTTNEARRIAYYIKTGKYLVFRPKGSFQAVSRTGVNGEGREMVDVYARYVGDPE